MKTGKLNGIVFTAFLFILLILPFAFGGFVGIYAYSTVLLVYFLFFFSTSKVYRTDFALYSIILITLIAILSAYFTVIFTSNVWYLREFIRLIFIIVFIFTIRETVADETVFNLMPLQLSLIVMIDWFLFNILSEYPISKWMMREIAMNGMHDYLENYWRHIGIAGNPNFSAFIYSIAIIFNLGYLKRHKVRFDLLSIFIQISLLLSVYLLFISYSRTSLIALVITLFISNFRIRHTSYYILLLMFLPLIFAIDIEYIVSLKNRFSSFSALTHRVDLWKELFMYVDIRAILIGKEMYVSVVDNDYFYFLYRYGLIAGGMILAMPWIIYNRCRDGKWKELLFPILLFYYISAMVGGPLAHPKTYVFLLFILAIGQNKQIGKLNVQKNSSCSTT